jgi:hypothetical protein
MVRFSQSAPSAQPCAADGRSRPLKVSADRDGSRLDGSRTDYQKQKRARTGASSCREQPPLRTLTGFDFMAEGVGSRSRTNSLSSMLRETSAAGTTATSTSNGASAAPAQQPADRRERQSDGRNSEVNPQEAHRSLHRPRDEDVPWPVASRLDNVRRFEGNPGKPRRGLRRAVAQAARLPAARPSPVCPRGGRRKPCVARVRRRSRSNT